jgi:two-component sensor histidine kinase
VEVNWNRGADGDAANLSIVWREIGGPTVAASPNYKYGVSIIRDLIPSSAVRSSSHSQPVEFPAKSRFRSGSRAPKRAGPRCAVDI